MISAGDLERSRVRMVACRYGKGWHVQTWRNIEYPRLITVEDWRKFREEPFSFTVFVDDIFCATIDDILARLNVQQAAKAGAAA
jgi:hypothetical protein